MIEIEEEYKLLEWIKHLQDEYASGVWNKDDDVKFKQILQDHEDAKKLHGTEIMLKRCQELGIEDSMKYKKLLIDYRKRGQKIHELSQDIKKWEENMILLSRNINDDLKQAKKDREIVKEIKEVISKTVEEDGFIEPEMGLLKIQKILEGKKLQ